MKRSILTLIIPFLFCITNAQSQWNKYSQTQLVISDIQGRTIWDGKMTDGLHTLDVSSYRNGLYFYHIEGLEYTAKGKFQVNH